MSNFPSKQPVETVDLLPSPVPSESPRPAEHGHVGVLMTGEDGPDGPKAFYIHIEARAGQEEAVRQMLAEILACVQKEPATGPWYGVRYSATTFGIFEVFPDSVGRQGHVDGKGGDIFRDVERMNALLAYPAHVYKLDVLFAKELFARRQVA